MGKLLLIFCLFTLSLSENLLAFDCSDFTDNIDRWDGCYGSIIRSLDGNEIFSYQGNFEKGTPEGKGVMTFPNGDKFEGELRRDLCFFQCEESNSYFEGNDLGWSAFVEGKYTWSNGVVHEGNWSRWDGINYPDSEGTKTWPNGSQLEGNWDEDGFVKGYVTLPGGKQLRGKRIPAYRLPSEYTVGSVCCTHNIDEKESSTWTSAQNRSIPDKNWIRVVTWLNLLAASNGRAFGEKAKIFFGNFLTFCIWHVIFIGFGWYFRREIVHFFLIPFYVLTSFLDPSTTNPN